MFFDEHPRFLDTGSVFTERHRLNLRHRAIIERNRDILAGARVLDIASHDGRWSFAALKAGAAHVTGIEARHDAVDAGEETFAAYGVDPSTYRFIRGDVFDVLGSEELEVDVVLLLGFLYHTYRHTELLHGIRRLNPRYVVVDTTVMTGDEPFLRLRQDNPDSSGAAVLDPFAHNGKTLVLRPSAPAVRRMLRAYDFVVEDVVDWPALIEENRGRQPAGTRARIGDYRNGNRVTMRARSR
jgi:hypothetical protein